MATAKWENEVIAQSDNTIELEGNTYFPPDAVRKELLELSGHHTACPWKGVASYYNVRVGGKENPNAAWFYAEPKPEAQKIKGYVAFWHGVTVDKS